MTAQPTRAPWNGIWLAGWALALATACPGGGGGGGGGGGDPTFSKSYGSSADDTALHAIPTSDGGYLMTGVHGGRTGAQRALRPGGGHEGGQLWAVKLDAYGDVEWERVLGLEPPAGGRALEFLLAREASDGSTWVAYRDHGLQSVPTGDAQADGGNVVVTRFDPAGVEQWSAVLDSGTPVGYSFASPNDTTDERVLDLWPSSTGGVHVVARTVARVLDGSQVTYLEGLWLLELSSSGTLLGQLHRTEPNGAPNYLGGGRELKRAFVREFSTGERVVVASGDLPGAWTNTPRTELLSIATNDLVQRREFVELATLGVAHWSLDDGIISQIALAGGDPDGTAVVARYDVTGTPIGTWTANHARYREVAARARLISPGQWTLEYFLAHAESSDRDRLERRDATGTLLDSRLLDGPVTGLDYERGTDSIWSLRRDALRRFAPDFSTLAERTGLELSGGWFGPGGPLVDDGELLREVQLDGDTSEFLVHRRSGTFFEGGIRCAEGPDGSFCVGGLLGYDPEAPALYDPYIAWFGLGASGDLEWQRAFAREGIGLYDTDLVPLPVEPRDGRWLVTFGGARLVELDGDAIVGTGSDVVYGSTSALCVHSSGDSFALVVGEADQDPATLVRRAPDDVARWAIDLAWPDSFDEGAFFPPATSLHELEDRSLLFGGTLQIPGGSAPAICVVDPDGTPLESWAYRLDPWIAVDGTHVAPAAGGGAVLATTVIDTSDPAGSGYSNLMLLRLDANWQPVWYRVFGAAEPEYVESLVALESGWLCAGASWSLGEGSEAWLLRTDLDGEVSAGCNARLAGGDWPAEVARLELTVAASTTSAGAAEALPVEAALAFAPRVEVEPVVARQCFGSADPPSDPPDDPPSGGPFTLTIVQAGGVVGLVTSSPSGLDCGSTCTASFEAGTEVFLTPLPPVGAFFSHWEDVDVDLGIEGASVTMNADRTVLVYFE